MENYLKLLFVLLLVNSAVSAQEKDCTRETTFGDIEICLPSIETYQECYTDPIVKRLADMTEVAANNVLGFYVNNQTYEKRDSFGLIRFDDYFKFYGTIQLEHYKADTTLLQQMKSMMSANFISKNWDSAKKSVDELGLNLEVGVPVVVKTYEFNDNSFTAIMLTKYQVDQGESYTLAMSVSGLLIKERLIWLAYYLDSSHDKAIEKVEEKTNLIIKEALKN